MLQEKWIPSYEGRYAIREDGVVLRYKKDGSVEERFGSLIKTGYAYMTLSSGTSFKTFPVHRLVAQAFIPNPENKPVVRHINKNRADNRVSNLKWCSLRRDGDLADIITTKEEEKEDILTYRKKLASNTVDYLKAYKEASFKDIQETKRILETNQRDTEDLETKRNKLLQEVEQLQNIVELLEDRVKILEEKKTSISNKLTTKRKISSRILREGRKILVNGVCFPSVTRAAKFIARQENKNWETIKKELRRFVKGERDSWCMYDKYLIG